MVEFLFLALWWIFILLLPKGALYCKYFWYGILVLLLIVTGAATIRNYYRQAYPKGTIVVDTIVRAGPGETYGACGSLKMNDKVVICDVQGDWRCVQESSDKNGVFDIVISGWILQGCVKLN